MIRAARQSQRRCTRAVVVQRYNLRCRSHCRLERQDGLERQKSREVRVDVARDKRIDRVSGLRTTVARYTRPVPISASEQRPPNHGQLRPRWEKENDEQGDARTGSESINNLGRFNVPCTVQYHIPPFYPHPSFSPFAILPSSGFPSAARTTQAFDGATDHRSTMERADGEKHLRSRRGRSSVDVTGVVANERRHSTRLRRPSCKARIAQEQELQLQQQVQTVLKRLAPRGRAVVACKACRGFK